MPRLFGPVYVPKKTSVGAAGEAGRTGAATAAAAAAAASSAATVRGTSASSLRVMVAPSYRQPFALEHDLDLARLADVASLGPFHLQRTAVAHDAQLPLDASLHDGGHRRAGRSGARRARVAHAALPEADAQLGGRHHGHELHVGAARKEGMALEEGAQAREQRILRRRVEEDA